MNTEQVNNYSWSQDLEASRDSDPCRDGNERNGKSDTTISSVVAPSGGSVI